MTQRNRPNGKVGPADEVVETGRGAVLKAADAFGNVSEVLALEESSEVTPGVTDAVVSALLSSSNVNEQFRILGARVQRIGEQQPFRCIGIVSATGEEGKTTTAVGLAHALGQQPDCRVLLIEADLRKPSLERYLSIPTAPGLAEWLRGGRGPCPVRKVGTPGFWLLGAGKPCPEGGELLSMPRMGSLLGAVRNLFDFTIVDCPPLVPVADAVILQEWLDGCLLVVRARHSPRETLRRAVSHLKPGLIQGVVFNDQREILSSYHSYGHRYGDPPGER